MEPSSSWLSVAHDRVRHYYTLYSMRSRHSNQEFLSTHLPHRPLIDNYAHVFHHRDKRNTVAHRTLRILSYCDNNTRYIVDRSFTQLVLQVYTSLDKADDFPLVTKIGQKHKKCNVAIVNSEISDTPPTFTSTAWSYDHEAAHTCQVETHMQSLTNHELVDDIHDTDLSSYGHEFNSASITPIPTHFFVITTTLTVDITQSAASSL